MSNWAPTGRPVATASTGSFYEIRLLRLESRHLPVYLYALGDVLIDTGFARAGELVEKWLREGPPRQVLVTHHHEDHSGNVARAASLGAPLLAHPSAIARIGSGFRVEPYRRWVWGLPERARCSPPPEELPAGPFRLRVLHVPGHSDDMVALHEPERGWLFTADLFLGTRIAYLRADEDAPALLGSLERVLRLQFSTVFCAHRGVIADGRQKLEQKRAYLEDLRGRIRELASRGLPPKEIARRLLGREGLMYYLTAGHFARRHLVRSFLELEPDAKRGPS